MNCRKVCGNLTIFIMFGFYPLFMTNGYYNITLTKYAIFGTVTLLMSMWVIISIFNKHRLWENQSEIIDKTWKNMTMSDKCVLAFMVAELLAFLGSENKYIAFTGCTNKYMGFFTAMLLTLLYILIRCTEINMVFFTVTAEIADCLIVLFSFVQFCGVDLLGILQNVEQKMAINYISPLGNTGIFGIYLILIMPLAIANFCTTRIREVKVLSGTTIFFNYIGMLIANTDATFMGIFVVIILCAVIYGTDGKYGKEFMMCLILMAASGITLRTVFLMVNHRPVSRFGQIALSFPFTILFLVIATVFYFLWGRIVDNKKILLKIKKAIISLTIGGVFLAIGLIIYFSIFNKQANLGAAEAYLRMNDAWGSGRGYVWSRLLKIYASDSIWQKMFGAGQGMVLVQMIQNYKLEMAQELKYIYDNAHNVYIHYLCTVGLFGVGTYIVMIANAILDGMEDSNESFAKIGAIILFACAVTDTVSILQPITVPFLWIWMALIQNNKEKIKKL